MNSLEQLAYNARRVRDGATRQRDQRSFLASATGLAPAIIYRFEDQELYDLTELAVRELMEA